VTEDTIDTPSLERRVAYLESHVADLITQVASLTNLAKYIDVPKAGGQKNCPHCHRKVMTRVGEPCPLCGRKA
jgi:hypothetical protein